MWQTLIYLVFIKQVRSSWIEIIFCNEPLMIFWSRYDYLFQTMLFPESILKERVPNKISFNFRYYSCRSIYISDCDIVPCLVYIQKRIGYVRICFTFHCRLFKYILMNAFYNHHYVSRLCSSRDYYTFKKTRVNIMDKRD